jgi:uncharacterized protein YjdB
LTNGTAYTFTVTATNGVGTSVASAASNSVTPTANVPDAPVIGTVTAGNQQATVNFTAPANDGGSAITEYTVTSSPGGLTATGTDSPITITGLTNGTAYTFTVTAPNGVGTSATSSATVSVTPEPTAPDAPTDVSATAGDGLAIISFTAPVNDGGSPITGYTIYTLEGGIQTGTASYFNTDIPKTINGLTNGTEYVFQVIAVNAIGISARSAFSNAVIPAATIAVTDVSLNKSTTTLSLNSTEQLIVTVAPVTATNKNVGWSSDNTAVATVVNGLVSAVSVGTATITVTTEDGNKMATCTVTVTTETIAVTDVSLNKTTTTLLLTATEQLTETVAPANATNKNGIWSSDNTAVATVVDGLVSAVSDGTATITVTTEDGNKTATCTVTVITSQATGALTISQADIVYGETPSPVIVSQTGDGTVSYEYKSQNAGDDTYSGTVPKVVGNYTVRGTLAETASYSSATATADFAIAKATLTVTVADTLKIVGMSNPSFRIIYEGFVYDENETALLSLPIAQTTATTNSPVGTYPISTTGGSSDNYTFDRHNGVLRVIVGDARLLDIQISTSELSPAFSSEITDYVITLSCGETAVTVSATASTGSTVTYIPGSSTVQFDNPGAKTLVVRSTAADGATMDYTIKVVSPYPQALLRKYWNNVLAVNLNPAVNGNIRFTGYQWTLDGVVLPGETGAYLHLTDSPAGKYGVLLSTTDEIAIPVCEGVEMPAITLSRTLKVYPNPVSVMATVENIHWKMSPRMQLYDLSGRLVREYQCGNSLISIDLSGIPAGVLLGKALQAQHEVSVYGSTGYSQINYSLNTVAIPASNGSAYLSGNKLSFAFGLGYTYTLSRDWAIVSGAELTSLSATSGVHVLADDTRETYSYEDRTEEMIFRSRATGFAEKQKATYLQIPLMAEYRIPTVDDHRWYVAAGLKLGFVAGSKYEATADNLTTSGYFPEWGSTFYDMPEHGFVNVQNPSWSGKPDYGINVAMSAETGLRWALTDHIGIYTGVYIDYGLTNIAPAKDEMAVINYQPDIPTEFIYNSVVTSKQQSTNSPYMNKMNLISIGVKLRVGFGF